jgi:TrmH family RNA methyltransferase
LAKRISIRNENNDFQHVEVIKRNREKRARYGKIFVEGVSAINLAIKNGWKFDTLIYSHEAELSSWAAEILREIPAKAHLELAPSLMAKLSDKEDTSELLAIIEARETSLAEIEPHQGGLLIVFDRPASPGNLGTSIRTADAFGADAVIVTGHAADIYDPQTIRSSVGTLFARPVLRAESPKDISDWCASAREKGFNYEIIGTSAKAEISLSTHDLSKRPLIVLMGNETSGLSRSYRELCDTMLTIPISGSASSLNVSSALSIVLYEINRQRSR